MVESVGAFPYPPGDYGALDTVCLDGTRHAVCGEPQLLAWITAHGFDPQDVYRVRRLGSFLVLVYRYRNDRQGHKYLSRLKKWLSRGLVQDAARRVPAARIT